MSDKIELTGKEFLEQLKIEVEKDFGLGVVETAIEQNDQTGQVNALFLYEDKIGYVVVPTDAEIQ